MSNNPITVKDDSGIDYVIPDIKVFKQHLVEFHHDKNTVHEENGHYFTVTEEFRQLIDGLAASES